MDDPFAGLEPQAFWRHFAALTAIPRPSHEEEAAVAHVTAWAGARGLERRRDAVGNLVVAVPGTGGREQAPVLVLQGHLDMVCERAPASPYDPREGRIRVVRDGDWITADGTTLGADNGVAIAAMMAFAEADGAPHGPLELLMTVDEEVGLQGAQQLDPGLISGDLLLNLDSEEDASLTVGCAGSADAAVTFERPREPAGAGDVALRVTVSGGRGGHSGGDIALGRANAVKVLARVLRSVPLRLVALDGGASRNAIPRDAAGVVLVTGTEAGAARAALAAAAAAARAAFGRADPGLRIEVDAAAADVADAWTAPDSRRILDLIAVLPTGPLALSPAFPGTVQTSSSLGVARTADGRLTLGSLARSADDAALADLLDTIAAAAGLAGATFAAGPAYPAWQPDLDSPLLATAVAVHEELFGARPAIALTHGGLETALIGAKRPGLDMLSLGPAIEGPHAPGERLHIASAGRFMRLLAALADALSR